VVGLDFVRCSGHLLPFAADPAQQVHSAQYSSQFARRGKERLWRPSWLSLRSSIGDAAGPWIDIATCIGSCQWSAMRSQSTTSVNNRSMC
jgi:hypothetical protein